MSYARMHVENLRAPRNRNQTPETFACDAFPPARLLSFPLPPPRSHPVPSMRCDPSRGAGYSPLPCAGAMPQMGCG
jgi:hypothetical protein